MKKARFNNEKYNCSKSVVSVYYSVPTKAQDMIKWVKKEFSEKTKCLYGVKTVKMRHVPSQILL